MNQAFRTVLAFSVAPLIPSVYLAVFFPLGGEQDAISVLGSFVVVYLFSITATVLLGVPFYFILRKFNLIRWWSATAGGLLVGTVFLLLITSNAAQDTAGMLRFAMLGASAGFLFWLVWRSGKRAPTSTVERVT